MKTFNTGDYTVNVCTDIIEWAKTFYDLKDDETLLDQNKLSKRHMGFSDAGSDKEVGGEIWLFIPKELDSFELGKTISHEIGHIIELEFPKTPSKLKDRSNDHLHEAKANHYEQFYILVQDIHDQVIKIIENE